MNGVLKRFRNYCGLIKVARSGFPWEKTTKGDVAPVYTNYETAIGLSCGPDERRLSDRKRIALYGMLAPTV
jgi:hypothetical protein